MSALLQRTGSAFASLLVAIAIFYSPIYASSGDTISSGGAAASGESAVSEESTAGEEAQSEESATSSAGISADVVGFYVSAVIPENQMDNRQTYFNLRMEPAQEQVLEVQIINENDVDIRVEVQAITASTNINGIIDYRTPGIQDESLETAFSDIAEVLESPVSVPANGTATAQVRVQMPEEEYDGILLGGLVFTRLPADADDEESSSEPGGGTSIQNVYSYVLGVVLRETDVEIEPDFELVSLEAALVNFLPAYSFGIRNTQPRIIKGMDVYAAVYRGENTDADPVVSRFKDNLDMAPNSVLEFAVNPENGELEAGDYTGVVTLRLDGQEWQFSQAFTVEAEQAESVNDAAPATDSAGVPWVTILLVVIGVLAAGLVAMAIVLARKRGQGGKKG